MTQKNSPAVRVVEIDREPIDLYKLLKFENLVQSGGEAKFVISQGMVRLNGSVETQKRKKIVSGDVVEFNEDKFSVAVVNPA